MFERTVMENVLYELQQSPLSELIKPEAMLIMVDEQPPPSIGDKFVLIYPNIRSNSEYGNSDTIYNYVKDQFYFNVLVGIRSNQSPPDRLSNYLTKEYNNLFLYKDIATLVISTLFDSNNSTLLDNLLSNIADYPTNIIDLFNNRVSIVEPYRYLSSESKPIPRYPDYFYAKEIGDPVNPRPSGHTLTIEFQSPSLIYSLQC